MLCSAGAGAKADPTRLRILDVAESVADPLARAVRHRWARARWARCAAPAFSIVTRMLHKPEVALLAVGRPKSRLATLPSAVFAQFLDAVLRTLRLCGPPTSLAAHAAPPQAAA